MMATLGIQHVERNGHHYFRGLSAWPKPVQEAILTHHGDLYHRHSDGYPTLYLENGKLSVSSLLTTCFGVRPQLDLGNLAYAHLDDASAFLAVGLPS